jgi:phosphoglycolate phosphatase
VTAGAERNRSAQISLLSFLGFFRALRIPFRPERRLHAAARTFDSYRRFWDTIPQSAFHGETPLLRIAGREYDPRLIIFDKDGTLIAFHAMWHAWYAKLLDALAALVPLESPLLQELDAILGVDSATGAWDPVGPLTLASTGELKLLIAGSVYRYAARNWPEALRIAAQAEDTARLALDEGSLVQPIGDLAALLERLHAAGLRMAIATTDNRAPTEHQLHQLGVIAQFDTWVCGDDGLPLKPAADMALEVCRRLHIPPEETLLVGDTIADMDMAHAAGCAGAIAVGSGAVPPELLASHADVVIADVHAIEILSDDQERV